MTVARELQRCGPNLPFSCRKVDAADSLPPRATSTDFGRKSKRTTFLIQFIKIFSCPGRAENLQVADVFKQAILLACDAFLTAIGPGSPGPPDGVSLNRLGFQGVLSGLSRIMTLIDCTAVSVSSLNVRDSFSC